MKGFGEKNHPKKKISSNYRQKLNGDQLIKKAFQLQAQGDKLEAAKYYSYLIKEGIKDYRVYSNFGISREKNDELISVTVELKNDSNIDGEEVVQLYFNDSYSSVTRPVKELVSYKRVFIEPGETKTVKLKVPIENLAFYDINMVYCVEEGEFEFMVGGSSDSKFHLKKSIKIENRHEF